MGTEAFWVPTAIAALGAGTQYVNEEHANKRAQAAETQAILNQQEKRQEANTAVKAITDQIAGNSPQQAAARSTGEYVAQLRKNAAGSTQGGSTKGGTQTFGSSTSALPSNANASERYGQDIGKAQREVQSYGDTYASELGQIDAATRMREGEGLGMQTLAGGLNQINLASYGQNFVDQLRAQAAGRANPWVALFGNILGGAANQASMNPDAYFKPSAAKYGTVAKGGSNLYDSNLGDWAGALA